MTFILLLGLDYLLLAIYKFIKIIVSKMPIV